MRHVRAFVVACVALSLLLVPSTQAVAYEAEPVAYAFEPVPYEFDKDFNGPWLLGLREHMTMGCWGEGAVGRNAPRLQANRQGKWVTIAVAKMVNDARACKKDDYPLKANFYFTPKDRGIKDPQSRASWLTVRILNGSENDRYPVKVYSTGRDWDLDLADKKCFGSSYTFDEAQKNECFRILGEPWKVWFTENVTNSPSPWQGLS